jgi:PAS domain S-box-containing protein
MNGVAPERIPQMDEKDVAQLQESFRVFNQVTKNLERAYSRLENKAAGVEGRLQDANGRLRAKVAQLKSVTGELNGILDAIPCGVLATDSDGTVTTVNPAAERILGRPRHEIRGRDVRTLIDHRGRPILLIGREEVRTGMIVERLVCCLDGSERYLSGSIAALPDGGTLEILSDQTEVAHLRSQVTRLDTLAELGEMAAGVAHEIRNPMNGVEGFAGLLEKALRSDAEVEPDLLRRYTDRIRRGVAEVNGIISNLLLWARPEPARMDKIDLRALLAEVEADTYPSGNQRATITIEDMEHVSMSGDRLKLKLAIGNLVRNAVEATGDAGHVRVSTCRKDHCVQVIVDDDGPGIAPGVRARLFRPFTTTKSTGTGLGLALVRKFAELHGGSVSATTSPMSGARFVMTLPVRDPGGTP